MAYTPGTTGGESEGKCSKPIIVAIATVLLIVLLLGFKYHQDVQQRDHAFEMMKLKHQNGLDDHSTDPKTLVQTLLKKSDTKDVEDLLKRLDVIEAKMDSDVGVGKAVAMPSIQATPEEEDKLAKERLAGGVNYGGAGDKAHLGGFTKLDHDTVSPQLWRFMMRNLTVHSVLDVGCGRGISTSWFLTHGAKVLCAEGSHDAVKSTLLPAELVVEHDFAQGPWWPEETYDALWSIEFLEHVGRPYMKNYLPAFHKAALIFASHSSWGGWHHVEVQSHDWWDHRFASQGFIFSQYLTDAVHREALAGQKNPSPDGKTYNAQHLWTQGLRVYINPAVAKLAKHQHLFGGEGCYGMAPGKTVPCQGLDALPTEFLPLPDAFKDDSEWEKILFAKPPVPT